VLRGKQQLEYDFFTFRKSIALALASEWESMGCKHRKGEFSPAKAVPTQKAVRIHVSHGKKADVGDRFTSSDKHLLAREKIPVLENGKSKFRQMLCRQCKASCSSYWCRTCATVLCKDDCYLQWHTSSAKT
jgi:hypothetical protein